jgi:hypothetical protein
MSTVTMEELELETAELLPSRETLCCCRPCHPCCPPCFPPPCFEVSVCFNVCL